MASKMVVNSILGLRIFTLLLLAASALLIGTDNFKLFGEKEFFTDIRAYRYVLAVAVVSFIYSLIQLPFSIYRASIEKGSIKGRFLSEIDFYGDKVVSWLLASGIGLGFGITWELRNFAHEELSDELNSGADPALVNETKSKIDTFFNRSYIASAALLAAFIFMSITSVLTSIQRSRK